MTTSPRSTTVRTADARSLSFSTIRMPLPPPPAAALIMIGNPILFAISRTCASRFERARRSRHDRNARRRHQFARLDLVAHALDRARAEDRSRPARLSRPRARSPRSRRKNRSPDAPRRRRFPSPRRESVRSSDSSAPPEQRPPPPHNRPRARAARVRSASEKTATDSRPNSRQARMTRTAISPRLAINIRLNISDPAVPSFPNRSIGY